MGSRAQNPLSFPLAQRRGSHGPAWRDRGFFAVWLLLLLFLANCQSQPRLRVIAQEVTPTIQAAAEALAARIAQAGYETEVATGPEASAAQVNAIILTVDESAADLQPEGFRILPIHAGGFYLFQVIGKDQRGVLWGSQEVAEQIASSGRLETVIAQTGNRRLPLRAIALPLRLPEASDPRAQWREQVALLSRSRFNAVFLRTTQPLIRFVPIPGDPDAPETVSGELRAQGDWLRDLLATARDHGLDCYLWITAASLADWPAAASDAVSESPEARAPVSPLAKALPAVLGSYPELGGIVLDPDLIPSGDPLGHDPLGRDLAGLDPSTRTIWLAENVLSPLADSDDSRPVFLSVGHDAWPSRDGLSALAPNGRIRLLAPLPPATEPLPESDYPVLWRLDLPLSELRPWDDPAAAGTALQRIGARDPLGFLDVSWLSPDDSDAASPDPTPDLADSWFRLLLLGRMGYSPDLPEQYWVQQFAERFGPRAGLQVYAAASHANRILDALPREAPSSFPPLEELSASTPPDPIRLFGLLRSFLSEQEKDFSTGVVLGEALRERNGLLPGQPPPPETPATAASLEAVAREVLAQAAEAGRFGAWRDPANQRFLHRIQTVADAGLALGERHRAALALARFLFGGEEAERQEALSLLQSVQQRIAQAPMPSPRLLGPLEAQTAAVLQAIPNLAPWQWEKTAWEVGVAEGWTAGYPDPLQWTSSETASLREFGLFGLQLWMSSINQQSRPAFLVPATGPSLASESFFVARTMISIPSSGQLVLRLLSGQPGTVWVNGRPAAPLSPAQFPWPVGSPPPAPLLAQLFAQTVPPGPAEVIVSIPAATESAAVALQSTFAATARVPFQINAAAASQLTGGVAFIPSTAGSSLQSHLALISSQDGEAQADTAERNATQADFLFVIRDPGFYRIRLWSFWETSPGSGLDISLDGSSLGRNVGRDNPTAGRWHWVPVDTVAALGTGEHRLRITGWNAGARVGIVEISQPDALLPGS